MNTLMAISIKSETESWSNAEMVLETLGRKLNIEETFFPGLISVSAEMHDFLSGICENPKYTLSATINEKEILMRFHLDNTDYQIVKICFFEAGSRINELINLLADSTTFHDELFAIDLEFRFLMTMERVHEERRAVLKSFYRKSKTIEILNDTI